MSRLIDADKFCDFLNHYPLEKAQNNFMTFYRDALQHTFECEVDAVEVIRCKDCKHYTGKWCTKYSTKQFDINDICKDDDDYCSRAERKK